MLSKQIVLFGADLTPSPANTDTTNIVHIDIPSKDAKPPSIIAWANMSNKLAFITWVVLFPPKNRAEE